MKVVINRCYGGFGLSTEAKEWLLERGVLKAVVEYTVPWGYSHIADIFGPQEGHVVSADWRGAEGEEPSVYHGYEYVGEEEDIPRHHPLLVEVVETLGEAANDRGARLVVEDIAGTSYWVQEYDGAETLHTPESIPWVHAYSEEIPRLRYLRLDRDGNYALCEIPDHSENLKAWFAHPSVAAFYGKTES